MVDRKDGFQDVEFLLREASITENARYVKENLGVTKMMTQAEAEAEKLGSYTAHDRNVRKPSQKRPQ